MFTGISRSFAIFLVSFALVLVASTSGYGESISGRPYTTILSGTTVSASFTRNFGAAPSEYNPGGSVLFTWSDSTDTTGLAPDQIRLVFEMSDVEHAGTSSGAIPGLFVAVIQDLLPDGASYLLDSARITYSFPEGGSDPITFQPPVYSLELEGPPYPDGYIDYMGNDLNIGIPESGAVDFDNPGVFADKLTFEIVVDNIPEPATITLCILGGGGIVFRFRNRLLGVKKQ